MKKILLIIMLLAGFGVIKSYGQTGGCAAGTGACDIAISGVEVQIVDTTCNYLGNPNVIEVIFNLKFKLTSNSGNKWVFIHSWLQADYPTVQPPPSVSGFFPCGGGATDGPTSTNGGKLPTVFGQVGRSFLNIGLDNSAAVTLGQTVPVTILPTNGYVPDPAVILNSPNGPSPNTPGMTVTKTRIGTNTDSFSLTQVRVLINQPCNSSIIVKSDVWATNANSVGKAQCWVAGITQGFNDPLISGFKNCNNPRQYALGITTENPNPTTLTFSVWIDNNDNGSIDGGDVQAVGPVVYNNFSSANPYSSGGPVTYPGSNVPITAEKDLIISASTPLIANSITAVFEQPQGCIGLPANFKSFEATRRSNTSVALKWETTQEMNNAGFAIERKNDGDWVQVAFVPTLAPGGNSNEILTYTFNDPNNSKGMTQYRIKQVDQDTKTKYSVIRAVRGVGQTGKTIVYPNPTSEGRVTVVFEDGTEARDLSLTDMTGRVLKQWKGVTNNNIQIDNLNPGMYTLRIVIPETGAQSVEKIIVNKR